MALSKLGEAALKISSDTVQLVPADDAGLWHGIKNTFARTGRAFGNAGESFLKGFDQGYRAIPQGLPPALPGKVHDLPFLGKVQRGLTGGSKDFLNRFWDEGGTSGLLGIAGLGLAGYGAKKLYDEKIKKQDPYAGMYPPVG